MRRFLLVILTLFSLPEIHAGTVRWDNGAANALWSDPNNWDTNILPAPGDDVILDNTFAGSYFVFLPDGNVSISIRSLTINPSAGNNIYVVLPAANISPTALLITGPGESFLINDGGYFQNSSGAVAASTAVSVDPASFLRINNGGMYVHNSATAHAALVARLSAVAGTESGVFVFDVPAVSNYTISLSGITYGALELSASASGGFITYSASGANPAHINDDLLIGDNVTLGIIMSADLTIHDTCTLNTGAVFNLQGGVANNKVRVMGGLISDGTITESGIRTPELELCGTINQPIRFTVNGIMMQNVILNMNNAAGATLETAVTLPYRLVLTSGKITTTAINILTIDYLATATGGSTTSFVEGPMKKIGDENFTFPIGIGSIYAPITISDATGAAIDNEFIAEYKRANPQTSFPFGPGLGAGLNHISYVEYWTLEQPAGSSSRNVTLDVHHESFCKELLNTYITRWDGFAWSLVPTTVVAGPTTVGIHETGALKSTTVQSGFNFPLTGFTLGTDLTAQLNPLPINLIAFDAVKLNSFRSLINWELAVCCSSAAKFELQRRDNDGSFATVATIGGSETSRFYSYTDNGLQKGVNYYRLRMIDADGTVTYSRVAAILNENDALVLASLAPTIVRNTTHLTVASSASQKLDIIVVDMQGRVVYRQNHSITAGSTAIPIHTGNLAAGIYQLYGMSASGKTNVIRFIKE